MARTEPFELFSDDYDQWFVRNKAVYELELQALRSFVPLQGAGVEVGVGTGKFAGPLGIRTGLDPSRRMAAKARDAGIQVALGTAEALPVLTGRFDFVLMVTTICFVDDIAQTFREGFRILRKGGFIVVGFVDKESELGQEYLRRKNRSRFYRWAEFFSARKVLQHLAEAGFGKFEIKQTLFPAGQPQHIANGLGSGSFVVIKGTKPNPPTGRSPA